ncbi:xanthine dehydrogenase family protein subunit M [Roseomonas sp. E05]|uniref:FAD binding domain-containing protein n=1 Tax=Roseomonas sp. E05 TaxID=3046310 RepID=UPI0024BA9C03|nr:xanthine dehydrogenase family protein subunit M [Roseomonas sp. E05]MDJ0388795.1 xanthine dehydrogenase family protein subunit M [Roseomonas sp. E05]
MKAFSYHRASGLEAARQQAATTDAAILAGGTTLLDLAKCEVARPEQVIDITRLPGLDEITVDAQGLRLGALARMARVAEDAAVRTAFPAVAQALSLSASAQIRNMATIGGNLLQRTRCAYFRDPASFPACNRRTPGSGCAALDGITTNHALLGTSEACIATYPGDLAVALVALDAIIHLGERQVAATDFFLLPGTTPEREFALAPGEIITAVTLPASRAARRSTYLKLRDRASYEFATVSVAAGLELDAECRVATLRVALGGVATIPWRARAVEAALTGREPTPEAVREACLLAMQGATPRPDNRHKLELAPRLVARAIETLLWEERA